jgi:hypothetical protein
MASLWAMGTRECVRCGDIIGDDADTCTVCAALANPVRLPDIGDRPEWQSSRLHPYPSWQVTYQHLYDARQRATATCWDAGQVPQRFDIRGNWRVIAVFHIPGSGV